MTEVQESFRKIHDSHYPGILRFLTRLVGEHDAEDVAQEVFLKVSRRLPDFRGESGLGTWIYRIARNAAFDRLRSRSVRQGRVGVFPGQGHDAALDRADGRPQGEQAAIEERLIRKEMKECIRGRIESVPEPYREVLVLSELREMKNSEIAETLGTSLDTVKIRLHRARGKLRKDLEAHCALYRDGRNELACEPNSAPGECLPVSLSGRPPSNEAKTGR